MKAHDLLTSQGWRGSGHSLHQSDDTVGLTRPLLLAQKTDRRGLGTTQHSTSDQWWLNAFDEQLKGLDTSQKGKVTQTVTSGKLNSINNGSLGKYYVYNSFIRGGLLQGTISADLLEEQSSSDFIIEKRMHANAARPPQIKKTKEVRTADKEAKRERKEARQKRREEKQPRQEARSYRREARELRRETKRKLREERAQKGLAHHPHKPAVAPCASQERSR